ncbi:unnamed protein product [Effrenium voratum]|uniref:Uncharacterized protein n=1 Tax=Effrenium voratum TaxID=2562239 RepID=A0AA36IQ48_9DINO|nr:unnamed protein product [Effrenium voratum]
MFTDAEELEDLPPQDLRKFAEQISISGSPFRPEELARLMDGELDADAEFESCTVEFYAGLDRYFRVTDLAFFSPTEAEHREQLVGSYFQAGRHQVLGNMTYEEEEVVELVEEDCNESNESNASNDSNASNFSNCFTPRVRVPRSDPGFWTIDTRPGTGWSTRSLQPPLMAQRLWLQGAGGCRLREVEIRGYIASSLCHIEVSHPALGASREAALSRLAWSDGAVVVGAVGNEELRLVPGGWVSFRLRVGAEQPELELEVGVLEPGKPQTLRMMAYAPHAGPDDLGGSDAMAMAELHLREGSMTWRSAALTLGPGLWTVRLATEGQPRAPGPAAQ